MPVPSRRLQLAAVVLLAACGGAAGDPLDPPAPSGALAVDVTGLPSGSTAAVAVSGPGGFSATLDRSDTLRALAPGDYVVAAADVQASGEPFGAEQPSQQVRVQDAAAARVAVVYSRKTGRLAVLVAGLPAGAAADVLVTGPDGFSRTLTAADTLEGLVPGTYTVAPRTVTAGTASYGGTPASQAVTVARNQLASHTVTYAAGPPPAPTTGGLALTIAGVPSGATAAVTVTGPNGYSRTVGASANLDALVPGTYTVAAQELTSGVRTWRPQPASQSVAVVASATRAAATVTYAVATGELRVTVGGLPSGTGGAVTVTGPAGFSRALTATALVSGLAPGTYTVAASSVTTGAGTYPATPASQSAAVTAGAETGATVSYGAPVPPPPASLNLRIDAAYLVQSVQTLPDTVPIVAGRNAYLRVFVTASGANTATPAVRVRLFQGTGTTPVAEYTLNAPRAFTPTGIRQDTLAASWNQLIPAALVQPGLRLQAEVDPGNAIAETDEADNVHPAGGGSRALDVRAVNPVAVRFVPVTTPANGRTGNVTAANVGQYLVSFRRMFPVATVNADVRAAYTTTTTLPLQNNNGNGAWGTVLSEINAVRVADASTAYYYGVVPTDYSSGVAGMGFVPGRAAIGWDRLPSGDGVFAHEIGHNMSLSHAPCGGVSGADPAFPYAGGTIGVFGFDVENLSLKLPNATDLMGYCGNTWISDFHYLKALRYRATSANSLVLGASAAPGLLVWGRIVDGRVELEPAFEVTTRPTLPRGGPYVLEGLDAAGGRLFAYAFDGDPVADLPGDERHFAFVLPMQGRAALARLQVRGAAERRTAGAGAPDGAVARRSGRGATVTWDAAAYPMALVRDAATGAILSLARGGRVALPEAGEALDVVLSDGVRSRAVRLPAR